MSTHQVVPQENRAAMLDDAAVQQFATSLRGQLLRPGDAEYAVARRVYNAMIDKHPAVIARCADVADVIHAVNFARERGLRPAIRGGGHSGPGLGTCDGGLVIDLSPMRGVRVDPAARTVRVEGGATWGDVDHATGVFGLAVPCGIVASTGVGGLTLGGGTGYLTRRYGLTIDSLRSADVVLADGRFVTADADEHADLFWALRGGGGNFGVVTSLLFEAHPVGTVHGGPMLWRFEETAEMMRYFCDFIGRAPDDISGFFATLIVPPAAPFPEHLWNQKACGIIWGCTGPAEQAQEAFEQARRFRRPEVDFAGPLPLQALNSMFDALYPAGLQWYWKADFFHELSDAAIGLHVKYSAQLPTTHSTMHLYPIDGAAGRKGKHDTAFSFRDAKFSVNYVGIDPDPANVERISRWSRDYWLALHPHSAGGAYVNFMMDEGQERVQATYRDNYARLAAIKAVYDPHNLFRVNQNVKPAV